MDSYFVTVAGSLTIACGQPTNCAFSWPPSGWNKAPDGMSGRGAARVVIVGCGISGIAAARRLVEAGFNVHILEATGRSGGRIKTSTLGECVQCELQFGRSLGFIVSKRAFGCPGSFILIAGGLIQHPSGQHWLGARGCDRSVSCLLLASNCLTCAQEPGLVCQL